MNNIVLITVNYKNTSITEKFVLSANQCRNNSVISIIIVDNQSTQKSVKELEIIGNNSKIDVTILPSKENLFYWGGIGLALSKIDFNSSQSPNWILVANNDIIFNNSDIFKNLLKQNNLVKTIIAPRIIKLLTGMDQNPHMLNPLSLMQKCYYALYYSNPFTAKLVHFFGRFLNRNILMKNKSESNNNEIYIYAPHGACMIFSKEFFLRGGYLDIGFSFYGEELSIAEISRKLELPITYIPDLVVHHNEHASTSSRDWFTAYSQSKKTYKYLRKKYTFKT